MPREPVLVSSQGAQHLLWACGVKVPRLAQGHQHPQGGGPGTFLLGAGEPPRSLSGCMAMPRHIFPQGCGAEGDF